MSDERRQTISREHAESLGQPVSPAQMRRSGSRLEVSASVEAGRATVHIERLIAALGDANELTESAKRELTKILKALRKFNTEEPRNSGRE